MSCQEPFLHESPAEAPRNICLLVAVVRWGNKMLLGVSVLSTHRPAKRRLFVCKVMVQAIVGHQLADASHITIVKS